MKKLHEDPFGELIALSTSLKRRVERKNRGLGRVVS